MSINPNLNYQFEHSDGAPTIQLQGRKCGWGRGWIAMFQVYEEGLTSSWISFITAHLGQLLTLLELPAQGVNCNLNLRANRKVTLRISRSGSTSLRRGVSCPKCFGAPGHHTRHCTTDKAREKSRGVGRSKQWRTKWKRMIAGAESEKVTQTTTAEKVMWKVKLSHANDNRRKSSTGSKKVKHEQAKKTVLRAKKPHKQLRIPASSNLRRASQTRNKMVC